MSLNKHHARHERAKLIRLSVILLSILLAVQLVSANDGDMQWTWKSGPQTLNSYGEYGSRGIPNSNNRPGARAEAVTWVDNQGHFWLFGGKGYDEVRQGLLNDLWRYDPSTGVWVWMHGSRTSDQAGQYGARGEAGFGNSPGSREKAVSWTDNEGNLWLYGGRGYATHAGASGLLNDIWKFDVSTNMWTWVLGSNLVDTPRAGNPEGRVEASSWVDGEGYFWLYSGDTLDTDDEILSDLWRFDPQFNHWQLFPSNHHLGTLSASSWTADNGQLWLFGGIRERSFEGRYYSNILLQYNEIENDWVGKGGGGSHNTGIYGPPGIPNKAYRPGGRASAPSWTDKGNSFWLFGGHNPATGYFRDLWRYNTHIKSWVTIRGNGDGNLPGIYGTLNSPSPDNTPGSRASAATWTADNGDLYMFGGMGYGNTTATEGLLSDMWTFRPVDATPEAYVGGLQINVTHLQNQSHPDRGVTVTNIGTTGTLAYDVVTDIPWITILPTSGEASANPISHEVVFNTSRMWHGSYSGTISIVPVNPDHKGTSVPVTLTITKLPLTADETTFEQSIYEGDPLSSDVVTLSHQGWYSELPYTAVTSADWITVEPPTGSINSPGTSITLSYDTAALSPGRHVGTVTINCPEALNPEIVTTTTITVSRRNTGEFTWMGGDSTATLSASYGTLGVEAPTNYPGTRFSDTSWTGEDGNFYLFGGHRIGGTSGRVLLNDLWKFNPSTKMWTWMDGSDSDSQAGVYGTRGVPHMDNFPGARYYTRTVVDHQGDLWLFGGIGYGKTDGEIGTLNDLWRMDHETGLWTWVAGSDTIDDHGVYELADESTATLTPPARYGAAVWVDYDGNFWLFSGYVISLESATMPNDLWMYHTSSDEWRLIKYRPEQTYGTYGTLQIEDSENMPGRRTFPATWVVEEYIWMFGGSGRDSNQSNVSGYLNDVWRLNLLTHNWSWMNGSNIRYNRGAYVGRGVMSPDAQPPGRYHTTHWMDKYGKLWIFGGQSIGEMGFGFRNDLWIYDKRQNMWTWMKGSTTTGDPGHYGTIGVPEADNLPAARRDGAGWEMEDGTIWIFGGVYRSADGYPPYTHPLNDMWKYTPPEPQSGIDWSLIADY